MTQGYALDGVVNHLQEAPALHLNSRDLARFGLQENTTKLLTMELEAGYTRAPQTR